MKTKKVTLVLDLQFGSTGKGKVAGRLAMEMQPDVVVNANMPNAGHTYIDANGRTWVHKVLPNGIVSPRLKKVGIAAGSVFDVDRLRMEMGASADLVSIDQLAIHESAVVLQEKHREAEQSFDRIGSTRQGSAEAVIEKMRRDPNSTVVAKDVLKGTEFEQCVVTHAQWLAMLQEADEVLAEGAQGYSLGLNAGFYPYCTSRDCTTPRLLAEMGVPMHFVRNIVGVARTYPIRVGGTSGGCYPDQRETDWAQVNRPPEFTTVTKKQRRIFTYSPQQMQEALVACSPTHVVLNFADYCDDDAELAHIVEGINGMGHELGLGAHVGGLGTGAGYDDFHDMRYNGVSFFDSLRG